MAYVESAIMYNPGLTMKAMHLPNKNCTYICPIRYLPLIHVHLF